jgi:hypothetical protein
MDIIVTTPRSEMANAAREAADCIRDGGGQYFRRFPLRQHPLVEPGDRVYYVEDGFIRGFARIEITLDDSSGKRCDTTGRDWSPGFYVYMAASSWHWIRPIPMRGFQGFRYVDYGASAGPGGNIRLNGHNHEVLLAGGWRDLRPRSCRVCGCTDQFGCSPPRGPCHWVEQDLCSVCEERTSGR